MKSFFKSKKSISLYYEGDTGSIKDTARRKTLFFSTVKSVLILSVFLLCGKGFAQSDTYMYWDQAVGCVEFSHEGEDPKRGIKFNEDIENAPCIRVCENSTVNYYIDGSNITGVDWEATGGDIQSVWTSPQHGANIQWGAPGNGALTVEITYADNTVKTYTMCIEIINGPKAYFETEGSGSNTFCKNTPIQFNNLSFTNGGTDIIHYFWDFGDGNYSSAFEPEHSYDQDDVYYVTLTVTNKCNCSSKYRMEIIITEKENVHISCPGVVCEDFEKVTYTAQDGCGGNWYVVGGTIVSPSSGTSIDVVWDDIDPEDGFGYVNYRSDCGCPHWITKKIPVVVKKGIIKGDDMVCLGEQNRYSLPQWPTTEFNWYLVTDTSPSQIVLVDQRNEVIVEGLVPGIYNLICDYHNTLLGCSGTARMRITVAPGVEISGDEEFCSNSGNYTYSNSTGVPVDWELKLGTSVVSSSTGINFTYNFPVGGTYVLTATSSAGCASEPFIINVTETPATPTGTITGDVYVCSGVTYEYSYNNTVPNTVLVWEVTGGGTIQGANTGNTISVNFSGTGPYQVKVKRRSTNSMACTSGELILNVSSPTLNPVITNDDSLTIFCPSSISTFTLNLGGVPVDHIEWDIYSSTSNSNFGNIIGGIHNQNVTVSFNEISSSATGTLRATITRCGQTTTATFPITLYQAPTLGITTPGTVCAATPFNLTLTSSSPLTTGTITWTVNGVNYVRDIPTYGLTLSGITVDNLTEGNMTVNISASVTHPNGCHYNLTATQTMIVKPRPDVQITPGYNYIVCTSDPYSIVLHANINNATGPNPPTFEWFKNGSSLGITTSSLTIDNSTQPSPGGTYYVVVTANGCSTTSNNIFITEDCTVPQPCTLTVNPNLTLTATWTDCDRIDATATYNTGSYATSIQWIYPPAYLDIYGQGTDTPYFLTDIPGEYLLIAKVTYYTSSGPCVVTESTTVSKHYKAKFNYTVTCNGNGDYTVELFNNSTLFGIAENQLDFNYSTTGGTLSTSGNNATITNLTGGSSYTFTLDLQDSNGIFPVCTYSYTLNLPAAPNTNFTMFTSSPHCAEDSIELQIASYDPANTYIWDFDNTTYIASGVTTFINITNTGVNIPIKLIVVNQYGCVFESTVQTIDIIKADFNGYFAPSPVNICAGDTFSGISFTPTGGTSTVSSITWMKGNTSVGTGSSFIPTQSGQYWAVIVDTNGCNYYGMAQNPVNVTIRQRPYVNVTGNTTLCSGEETTLNGIVMDPSLERRWLLNGSPVSGSYGIWNTSTPTSLTVNTTIPGTYTYTFEVRPTTDTSCGNSMNFTVTVHPAATQPSISYSVILCEPYTVEIVASGPAVGNYNWSNGDSGQVIYANAGGAYEVTYTAPTGCTATAQITVPHNTDRYLWIFPEGCFDVCVWSNPTPYIIGPWGTFDIHKWIVNGNVVASGSNSPVYDLAVNQAGTYQLYIENEGCEYESGIAYITPDLKECEVKKCNVKHDFKKPELKDDGTYAIFGFIDNPFAMPITVNLSSFNGFGTYNPSSVTIPPGGTYNFTPLVFTPAPGFNGGNDFLVISIPEIPCITLVPVSFAPANPFKLMPKAMEPASTDAILRVTPNPASQLAAISYDLGTEYQNAESIQIYTIVGTLVAEINLKTNHDNLPLDISQFPAGTYIVTLQADGETVLHQKLIKK